MKASEVIRIGRNRMRDDSIAASTTDNPFSRSCSANSTIRIDGEAELEIGKKRIRLGARESMFIPRNIEHAWAAVSASAKILNTYQPAGKIEEFFQALAKYKGLPTREQAIKKSYTAEQTDG